MHSGKRNSTRLGDKQVVGNQRGISLISLIFGVAVVGCVLLLGAKIVPTFVEYRAIQNAIIKAKTSGTPMEARRSFDNGAIATYIDSIGGKDLIIAKSAEGGFDIGFAYEKRIPLVANASLVIDYEGSTAPGGKALAAKPAE